MGWIVLLALLCGTSSAIAQTSDEPPAHPATLGFTYDESFLRDLPLSDSLYSILETVQPSIIPDRFTEGGLFTGQAARVGGFQASWTQTRILIGDVDLSDPNGTGAPMLFPDLGPWRRIRVATGLMPGDVNAPGLAITLDPLAASAEWRHVASGAFSHGGLTADASTLAQPTIARLAGRDRLAWTSTGPLTERLGAAVALAWTRGSQFDRAETLSSEAQYGSALVSLAYSGATGGELQTIGWVQKARTPFEYRQVFDALESTTSETNVHLQSTWKTAATRAWPWRAFAAYTQRSRTPEIGSRQAVVERLLDGPVSAAASPVRGTVRQWTIGGRTRRARAWGAATHHLSAGLDLVGARQRTPPSAVASIGELTDGIPSRVWVFRNPSADSLRRNLSFSVHANDTVRLTPRATVSAGLRFESVTGTANGAAEGISWQTLLPRARLDWRLREGGATTAFIGYTRSAYRLALDLLAYGDPAAQTADLYRWDPGLPAAAAGRGALVARVGPGTGGNADFTRIVPGLKRPVSDELAFGVEANPSPRTRFQLAVVGRRESGFVGLVNLEAPVTAYTAFTVNDPGSNTGSPDDDKVISIYNRMPSTLGGDRYLLTNTGQDAALSGNLELSGQLTTARLTIYGGATASIAQGSAVNLGYGPLENDQSVVSDTYVTPNGNTFARGRLFNDRAFTIKLTGVYRFPWAVRFGAIARYQDGQPFSRVLVFPNLVQGTEAVRAFAAGDSRFRFIGTLDTRLSKGFAAGGRRVEAFLDAYNLLGLTYDVEEPAAAAPNDRTPIAIQPSRALHLGVRVAF